MDVKQIDMIGDRNKLSHVYQEDEFRKILDKFPGYRDVFKRVEDAVTGNLAKPD